MFKEGLLEVAIIGKKTSLIIVFVGVNVDSGYLLLGLGFTETFDWIFKWKQRDKMH